MPFQRFVHAPQCLLRTLLGLDQRRQPRALLAQLPVGDAQRRFHARTVGDVENEHEDAVDVARRVAQGLVDEVDGHVFQRLATSAVKLEHRARADMGLAAAGHAVQELQEALVRDFRQRVLDGLADDVAVGDHGQVRGVGELEHVSGPRSRATAPGACSNSSRQRAISASRSRRLRTTSVISLPWLKMPATRCASSRMAVRL